MKHVPALDGLRGIAILMVLAHHIQGARFPGGFIGVDVFFVLSGFLITRLFVLERASTGRISLRNFFIRRALRLMPALWLMVVAMLVLAVFTGTWERDRVQAMLALSYTTNIWMGVFQPHHPHDAAVLNDGVFDNAWSLAVEEQFYLCWALGALLLLRYRCKRAAWALVTLAIAFWCWRAHLLFSGADPMRIYVGFDARADELLAGCTGAVLVSMPAFAAATRRVMARLRYGGTAALFGLLVLAGSVADYYVSPAAATRNFLFLMPTVTSLTLVLILDVAEGGTSLAARLLSSPWLVYVGSISYGLYLWHWPLLVWARENGFDDSALLFLFGAIGGGFAAALSHRYIERPILGLKSRLTRPSENVGHLDAREIVGGTAL